MPNQQLMNKLLFVLLLLISSTTFGQTTTTEVNLFAQCLIEIDNADEMRALEADMRTNPYIKVVRLDVNSKRAFILTKDIDELSDENFISWFNQYSDQVHCIQIGRHGVDVVKPFPFEGCEN